MSERRRARGLKAVIVGTLVATFAVAAPALATHLVNEFAVRHLEAASPTYSGFSGVQEIRTDISTVSGVAYVHPTQVDVGPLMGDFLAVGTYNVAGTVGGVTNCPNDYDLKWNIYTDGVVNNVYFCSRWAEDVYTTGAKPSFSISFGWCASQLANRWLLSFGGTLWDCRAGTSLASGLVAGLEVRSADGADRNVDARYTSLQKRVNGVWSCMGGLGDVDPSYAYTTISCSAADTYLPPLN